MENFAQEFDIDLDGEVWANIYYKQSGNVQPLPDRHINILGDYSDKPWKEMSKCSYDHEKKLFYYRTAIKIGCQFKFKVDGSYFVSNGYAIVHDAQGNQNNIFLPNVDYTNINQVDRQHAFKVAFKELLTNSKYIQFNFKKDLAQIKDLDKNQRFSTLTIDKTLDTDFSKAELQNIRKEVKQTFCELFDIDLDLMRPPQKMEKHVRSTTCDGAFELKPSKRQMRSQ